MKVEDKPLTCHRQKRRSTSGNLKKIPGRAFWRLFSLQGRPGAAAGRPLVLRADQPAAPLRHPSYAFCVVPLDLASVSPNLRSVSNSVRRMHPSVSANLRRKSRLIVRRAVHRCAPLQLVALYEGQLAHTTATTVPALPLLIHIRRAG
jgi:hypothetical protein